MAWTKRILSGLRLCIYEQTPPGGSEALKSLYIDDLCVDEAMRGRHIGRGCCMNMW